jgi:hypothetical protein
MGKLYSKHILHLNYKDKESAVGKIVNVISAKITAPRIMKWKEKY